ncbi:LamG-like jellyroll fold domain-containing protein [Micromonospora sp. NPDC018662]|uniref:LamG-like jellyroll fold domain-containing protein n=1 Tax=Micromonospora sp. NPDC018662 TaxID=3364238 RepID=UPI0037877206
MTESSPTTPVRLLAWWRFDDPARAEVDDASGNGHTMVPHGGPTWTAGGKFGGGYALDGATQWFSTTDPVVRSDRSLSVAAWVRLDSARTGPTPALPDDWYAVTAVSQNGPSHTPFYLGVRLIDDPVHSKTNYSIRWNFTAAPVDGSETGPVEWCHAFSRQVIQPSELDRWVLLVGVYDLDAGFVRLYVPGNDDAGETRLPDGWPSWRAEGGVQLGQARFRDDVSDQWPGSIGAVRIYSGVLTAADAASLYAEDKLAGE